MIMSGECESDVKIVDSNCLKTDQRVKYFCFAVGVTTHQQARSLDTQPVVELHQARGRAGCSLV